MKLYKTNDMPNSSCVKKSFILAEVLITLAIIGVLSSMVIPSMQASFQEKELEVRAHRVVANFEQVMKKIMVDNNCIGSLSCTGVFDTNGSDDSGIANELSKYFIDLKKCGMRDAEGCFTTIRYKNDNKDVTDYSDFAFKLPDGSLFFVDDLGDNVGLNCSSGYCAQFNVDINGNKPPNELYKDFFNSIYLKNDGTFEMTSKSGDYRGNGYKLRKAYFVK